MELFALFNLGGLAPDIFLAHSTNFFRHGTEYIPLGFSLVSPLILLPAVVLLARGQLPWWRWLGYIVGWGSVLIGITGLVWHLESQFFQRWTLASLVYAAPFAAPLAYTGIGLLLIMNRMVAEDSAEWPLWVIFLALGGFVGNFIFSVTDHAQNGFYHHTEWIPVASSALAVGFMIVPLTMKVGRSYLRWCVLLMLMQAVVGLLGFALHLHADIYGVGPTFFDRVVYGAPVFAPMLFPDLVILALIGLWVFYDRMPRKSTQPWSA
ncbi:MAG: hypothetical protein ACRD4P_18285 [Bryobacteraceae bacterium]